MMSEFVRVTMAINFRLAILDLINFQAEYLWENGQKQV